MVYCTKCGFKNADDAEHCTQCGASLYESTAEGFAETVERGAEKFAATVEREASNCFGQRRKGGAEDECFGLRKGGVILGFVFGIIIILVGISIFMGRSIWNWIGPFFMIVIGLLIIAGSLSRIRH